MVSEYRRGQAWRAGKKAFESGKPKSANNRERGTIYYDDWWDGWNHAYNVSEGSTGYVVLEEPA